MNVFLEELRILRRMRIVARFTIHDGSFDSDMSLVKGFIPFIVALAAQCLNRLLQQRGLSGNMRLMAYLTVARSGLMNLLPVHSGLQILMAGEAEVGAWRKQQFGKTCLVRAVAL